MIRLDSYDAVELGSGDGWRSLLPAVRPEQRQRPDPASGVRRQLRDVVGAISRGKPLVSGTWARDTMAMLDAVQLSARQGDAVRLPV
jgi:predicted dehydrogenase